MDTCLNVGFSFVGGGEMISDVFLDHSTYLDPPSRLVKTGLLVDQYYK